MKKTITLLCIFLSFCGLSSLWAADVSFSVKGLNVGDKAMVSLASDTYLATQKVANGDYSFADVPAGKHFLKIEISGYNLPEAQAVVVNEDGSVEPVVGIKLVVTPMSRNENEWIHSWREDGSVAGYVTTAHINTPPEIDFLGKKVVPSDVASMAILLNDYHILLSDEEETWTQEYAYRLLETMKTIPCSVMPDTTKFLLTSSALENDITVTDLGGGKELKISKDAFYYANPFLVNMDGVRGRFFSKRLHHAMVNFVTAFGTDKDRADEILRNRFGCAIKDVDYEALTAGITDEDAACFQEFNPTELVSIINMFEEMPEGFHKIPHLNYLIRRQNGHKHPIYPEAAAVAWTVDNGYIEFMENSFGNTNESFGTLRLILHEKTHFLWEFAFSDEIKNDWIALGGWYKDPNADSGWSTTKDTEFVSAYAHAINPNEDMAESVAHYIKNPELLQSRSIAKYEFIRDRIMHGTRYISKIPDHLTFEVLNLYPDYDYPGKIKRLDVKVSGAPDEDKKVTIEIELNHIEGFEDGASAAATRINGPSFVDKNGNKYSQYMDVGLSPVDGNQHLLRGEVTISKYSKAGYWTASDIEISDIQGNQRFAGRNDYVWNMYVNNPLEDLEAPKYESGSLEYKVTNIIHEGHKAQKLQVSFKITDNIGLREHCPVMIRLTTNQSQYSWGDHYGSYDPETQIATIEYIITEFYPEADYYVTFLTVYDKAETCVDTYFSESEEHEPVKKIHIKTPNPDYEAPEIDLNRITVYAEPTNPEAPDGETLVTINYYARDNKSGLGKVDYNLKDPQGIQHFQYHYHRNFYSTYFDGDPTVWERYTINCVLPKGSAPGIWGLASMSVSDKAFNGKDYNFVETLIFEPDDSTSDYVLFSEVDENDILSIGLTSDAVNGYGFTYRIINEETGEEITGNVNTSATRNSAYEQKTTVDVSSLEDGRLIVIVIIKDNANNVLGVRSCVVNKGLSTGIEKVKPLSTLQVQGGVGQMILTSSVSLKEPVVVYNVSGKVLKQVTILEGKTMVSMMPGLYIVGGQKCLVR